MCDTIIYDFLYKHIFFKKMKGSPTPKYEYNSNQTKVAEKNR